MDCDLYHFVCIIHFYKLDGSREHDSFCESNTSYFSSLSDPFCPKTRQDKTRQYLIRSNNDNTKNVNTQRNHTQNDPTISLKFNNNQ